MASGLTRTPAPPTEVAAIWPYPDGLPIVPELALIRSCHLAPIPKSVAAVARSCAVSCIDRPAKAVPQACAKSTENSGWAPRSASTGWLEKLWPPTLFCALHGIRLVTSKPLCSRAAVEMMVKAWPGWYRPASGSTSGHAADPCWAATARILPVPGWMATMAADAGLRREGLVGRELHAAADGGPDRHARRCPSSCAAP